MKKVLFIICLLFPLTGFTHNRVLGTIEIPPVGLSSTVSPIPNEYFRFKLEILKQDFDQKPVTYNAQTYNDVKMDKLTALFLMYFIMARF